MCHAKLAFVDPPKLDFRLTLPAGSTDSGLLRFVECWLDAFIADSILSQYLLPDHYFTPIAQVCSPCSSSGTIHEGLEHCTACDSFSTMKNVDMSYNI